MVINCGIYIGEISEDLTESKMNFNSKFIFLGSISMI